MLKNATFVVAAIAVAKLLLHLYAGRHYGYFVDELYYIACSHHLDWGYVDQAPLIALITRISGALFGESLPAIRLFPALAGAALVFLTGLVARELGAQLFGQALAALAVLLAPGFLATDNFLSMNAFEPLFWTGCAYVLIRIIKTGKPKLWLWFGLLAGLGLANKKSIVIFGAGLVLGLMLTPERCVLRSPWFWIAGLLAFLLFLPNLLWNIQHHFPFLELQENIRRDGRNVSLSLASFFGEETLAMLPLSAPIWIAGLWGLLRGRYRALAFAWAVATAIILAMNPRVYYLFPAFPMLFAAGAVQFEAWLERPRLAWIKPVWCALMVLMGAPLAPTLLPILPPETYIRYVKATHLQPPPIENARLGPLPQLFADQFGWEDMAAAVARVYYSLPADIRPRTAIFGQNYGQAGAIDLFGPKYGLPPAISGHQNYFLWGPRGATGESMIVMAGSREDLERKFNVVRVVAHVEHPYAMPYEHIYIFYCQGLKGPLAEAWPKEIGRASCRERV